MQNNNADTFYRITGGIMVLSGLLNALYAFLMFATLVWVCVGAWWLVPGVLALGEIGGGIYLLATGKQTKMAAFLPGLSLLVSIMNLNFYCGWLGILGIVLGILGYTQNNEDTAPTV